MNKNSTGGLGVAIATLAVLCLVFLTFDIWVITTHRVNFNDHIPGFFTGIFGLGALFLRRINRGTDQSTPTDSREQKKRKSWF